MSRNQPNKSCVLRLINKLDDQLAHRSKEDHDEFMLSLDRVEKKLLQTKQRLDRLRRVQ